MGHKWEDLDITGFLSAIHVFVLHYLLNAHFMSSTNSRAEDTGEQEDSLDLIMELACYWDTMDSKQRPIFLLSLLTEVKEILLTGFLGSSQI